MSNNGSNNPYVQISPLHTNRPKPMDTVCDALNRCSRKVGKATRRAETMADNFWNHIRIGSSLADAAVARIVQGTKVLTLGGPDILFQQSFGNFPGEKLIKSFACYLSTSTGPVIGTIYVSTKRVAFCSDYPLCNYPLSLQQNQSVHYKNSKKQVGSLASSNLHEKTRIFEGIIEAQKIVWMRISGSPWHKQSHT
ncbi:GEM-like protein 1-like isoform X1 [Glycine max]|uniref:GRAM domain-containing protein n=1 Tax=Glycine max TaxID=3847 RepID=A0A0R0JKP4_SOYBN|nr:uncharacterized protein LOC100306065 isoform X1 [Glycine max]|eukprot:XP_006580924.1 uncharacterized protein LOC100306065 isoform X1 [Glycine max]